MNTVLRNVAPIVFAALGFAGAEVRPLAAGEYFPSEAVDWICKSILFMKFSLAL